MLASVLRKNPLSHSLADAFSMRSTIRQTLCVLAVSLCPFSMTALAAEFESEIESQAVRSAALSGGIQTDYIVQVLLSLLLVVGVIVLLSVLVKKFNLQSRTGSGAVRVLSVVPIGAKDKLLLVEVGEEQILLGSSPGSLQKLHKLETPIDLSSKSETDTQQKNFLSVLSSVRRGQQA